jgi:serine/threonine protein kinase
MESLPNSSGILPCDLFPTHKCEPQAHDLVMKMLEIHPKKRIKVHDALAHGFMESLANSDDEPVAPAPFTFAHDDYDLSRENVKDLMWAEIRSYHPQMATTPPVEPSRSRSDGTPVARMIHQYPAAVAHAAPPSICLPDTISEDEVDPWIAPDPPQTDCAPELISIRCTPQWSEIILSAYIIIDSACSYKFIFHIPYLLIFTGTRCLWTSIWSYTH